MPVFIKDGKYLLFVHVPKSGGTSMEKLFYRSGWQIAYLDMSGPGTLNHLRHCSPQHMHAGLLRMQFVLDRFDGIFMLVRNPYDRFRSEYCMASKAGSTESDAVEEWAGRVFEDYARDNYILDNHIRPQSEFWLPGAAVYRLEQGFGNITGDLEKRFGIELVDENIEELSRRKLSGFPSGKVVLSRNVKRRIEDLYREDFRRFDYPMEN